MAQAVPRRARRRARAKKARTVKRYNPDTGLAERVPSDSPEADSWPSRKPRARRATKAEKAVQRRVQRQVEREVGRGVGRIAPALEKVGRPVGLGPGLTAGYLATAGLVSYAVTRKILDAAAEGQTPANLISVGRSMAATEFQRKMGRRPTREEYADLRKRVGNAIVDHFAAALGSVPAMWRNFVGLFKGE